MDLGAIDSHYLQSNRDEIFKALIQAESHLRKLTGEKRPGFGACVMKHLAEAEGEAEEAVSHALTTEGVDSSERFKAFASKVREIRKRFQDQSIEPHEGLIAVKALRKDFIELSPSHDTSHCTKCERADDQVSELRELIDERDESGELFLISKGYPSVRSSVMNNKRTVTKEIVGVYGASNLARGAQLLFNEIDKATGKTTAPVIYRPSVWINIGLAVALPVAVAYEKIPSPYDLLALVAGGYFSTMLWKYAEEVTLASASAFTYVPTRQSAPDITGQAEVQNAAPARRTSYTITG